MWSTVAIKKLNPKPLGQGGVCSAAASGRRRPAKKALSPIPGQDEFKNMNGRIGS